MFQQQMSDVVVKSRQLSKQHLAELSRVFQDHVDHEVCEQVAPQEGEALSELCRLSQAEGYLHKSMVTVGKNTR